MAFSTTQLDVAAGRYAKRFSNVYEAQRVGVKAAFLSHSHKDRVLAKGLQVLLADEGWDLFLDWEHSTLDERPTKETAQLIQRAIMACDWLLYLATPNSATSRWCPWEIGFADGKKDPRAIVVIATTANGHLYGSEYLELYRQISPTALTGRPALFEAKMSKNGRYLQETPTDPTRT